MTDLILGVDPGLCGAFCLINKDTRKIVDLWDMPINYRNGKNEIDIYTLGSKIDAHAKSIRFAVVEEVGVMTGQEGRVSMFNFGRNAGVIHGALGVLSIPVYFVKPAIWKSLMGVTRNKETSLAKASEIFPDEVKRWPLKKHDGRAEAALLAHFGVNRFK